MPVLCFQTLQLQSVINGQQQLLGGNRFFEEIKRAQLGRAYRHVNVRLPGHHYDRRGDGLRFQFFQQRKPVFAGHHHVRQDQIKIPTFGQFERFGSVVADGRLMTGKAERAGERRQRVGLVVDDQKMCFLRQPTLLHTVAVCSAAVRSFSKLRGSSIRNVVPRPGSLCTLIRPP